MIVCYLPVIHGLLPEIERLVCSGTRVVYSADNDESALAAQIRSRRAARLIGEMEDRVFTAVPEAWVAGTTDAQALRKRYPHCLITEVPSGVRRAPVAVPARLARGVAFTYGSWTYPPNAHGLLRLVEGARHVKGTLYVYGTVPDDLARRLARVTRGGQLDVRVAGFVADLDELVVATGGPAVIPIWDGAGTKLRVVELAARGVPVFAPRHAFAGLPAWVGDESCVVDDPAEMFGRAISAGSAAWARARGLLPALSAELSCETTVRRAWLAAP